MRYCTSQLLAGAILIEGLTAIIMNAVEPYSRDALLDAHHERRLFGTATSFPSKPNKYGFLRICQLLTPDGLKLTIGSRTCNFLVTSSLRLDAVLELKTLLKLIIKTKKDSTVDNILSKIHLLFKEQDQITIIDNKLLNSQLTDLANGIGNKLGNDKKIEDISKALYD